MRWPSTLAALEERNFRLLFFGQSISLLGSGMVSVALAFAVLDLTGSVSDLGYVLAARSVPLVVFLLIGGVVADRASRRAVMLVSDLVRCFTQGLLAVLLIVGAADLWHVIVLQAVTGAATAFFMPASSAFTPEIVQAHRLQEANALRSFSNSAGNVAGPAIAGLLVATVGAGWAIAVDAASFAVGGAFLGLLDVPPREPAPVQRILHDLAVGWREFRSRTWLLVANLHAAMMNTLVLAPFYVLGPAVARRSLGGPSAWALIVSSFGVGLILGSVVAMRLRVRRRMLVGLLLAAAFAPPLALLAIRVPAVAIAPFALLAGAQLTLLNTFWETTLQEEIPPAVLSRVVAYDWLSSLLFSPIGYALAGVLAAHVLGIGGTLWLAAAWALGSSAAVAAVPNVRAVQARHLEGRAPSATAGPAVPT